MTGRYIVGWIAPASTVQPVCCAAFACQLRRCFPEAAWLAQIRGQTVPLQPGAFCHRQMLWSDPVTTRPLRLIRDS